VSAEWPEARLGDLVEIKHGFAFKGEFFTDQPTGALLLTPGNFAIGGGFQFNKLKFYKDGPIPPDYILQTGDLLVTMTDLSKAGDTLGYSAVVPDSDYLMLHNQRLGKVTAKNQGIDLGFIHWLLRDERYRAEVLGSATGSTVKHTSPGRIGAYRFRLPPLPEQRAIAGTLGVLDDKIELNRKMNATLEAMARALFRDWFVDFGPTRAKIEGRAPYLSPDLWSLLSDRLDAQGKPEGWEVGTLGAVAVARNEGVDPSAISPDTPYIGLEHMPRGSIALTEWEGAGKVSSNKAAFAAGDFLFGKLRPYFHKVGIAPVSGICSTDIVVVRPKSAKWSGFVIACISDEDFVAYTDKTSTGTKMPRTSWSIMAKYPVALPPADLAGAYNAIVAPMVDLIRANIHESRTLAQTRDLLLPRLMSGELRVAEAERLIGEVA
jgi:type I restriction enzyme S subunit